METEKTSTRITKKVVDELLTPEKGYILRWDGALKGFGVRVTANGAISFILQYRALGKSRRITLGRYGSPPGLTVEQARKKAIMLLGEVVKGLDPAKEKAKKKVERITLREACDAYVETRDLKSGTVKDLNEALKGFRDWMNRPLLSISREMVAKRHRQLGQRSKARANGAFRYLRAIFNFAVAQYTDADGKPLITDNPVKRLSETKAWYRIKTRQTVIKPHQLKPWMEAVQSLKNDRRTSTFETVGDFLMLVLLTGLRHQEAATLQWDQVDLEGRTLTVLDTKNRQDHTLPLSDYLLAMLSRRITMATNEYVFAASRDNGYLRDSRRALAWVKETSGVPFTVHDLRRTFATVADSLDVPGYAVKMLLNHMFNGDVTAGYIIRDIERLRRPMQRITDYILEKGGVK